MFWLHLCFILNEFVRSLLMLMMVVTYNVRGAMEMPFLYVYLMAGGQRQIVTSCSSTTVHWSSSYIGYVSSSTWSVEHVDRPTLCSMQRTLHHSPLLTAKVSCVCSLSATFLNYKSQLCSQNFLDVSLAVLPYFCSS